MVSLLPGKATLLQVKEREPLASCIQGRGRRAGRLWGEEDSGEGTDLEQLWGRKEGAQVLLQMTLG